jgi:hypothetical protein
MSMNVKQDFMSRKEYFWPCERVYPLTYYVDVDEYLLT